MRGGRTFEREKAHFATTSFEKSEGELCVYCLCRCNTLPSSFLAYGILASLWYVISILSNQYGFEYPKLYGGGGGGGG